MLSDRGAALVVLGVTFLIYADSLGGWFVFDDTVIIQGNRSIQGLRPDNIREIFGGHYWSTVESQGGLYRPVVMFSYALNYALGGENPVGYHFMNILVHALNGVLVFLLLTQLFGRRPLSFLSALLFVLHPIRTEGVASVVGRAESLSAFFVLAAWWTYLLGRKRRAAIWISISVFSFFLATLSKESSYAFVLLLPLGDIVSSMGSERRKQWLKASIPFYVFYLAGLMISLCVRYMVLGGFAPLYINPNSNPLVRADIWPRFLTATYVFAKYLWLLIVPAHLSADYSFNQIPLVTGLVDSRALISLFVLGAFLAGIVFAARRDAFLFFCGATLLVAFALTSNWIRPIGTIMAERLMYLPALGYTCALAYLLCEGMQRRRWRSLASVVAAALIGAYALKTADRSLDWRDHYALFSSAVRTSPESYLVQGNYATLLLHEKNDIRGAMRHAERAIQIHPGDPAAQFTLGEACRRAGELSRAATAFSAVARLAPRTSGGVSALRNLAATHEALGNNVEAIEDYKQILKWRPSDLESHVSLAKLYARMDQRADAVDALLKAKDLAPGNPAVEKALVELLREE